jgi:hypothetical protein
MRSRTVAALFAVGLFAGGAVPALAADYEMESKDHGAWAQTLNNGHTFLVADAKCDEDSVHGNYRMANDDEGSVSNNGGCNSTVIRQYEHTIIDVQACTDYFITPDNCSAWSSEKK